MSKINSIKHYIESVEIFDKNLKEEASRCEDIERLTEIKQRLLFDKEEKMRQEALLKEEIEKIEALRKEIEAI